MIEREDQYRFQVTPAARDDAVIWLECGRCPWEWRAQTDHSVSLAELNDRASEHAEVCR